MQVVPKIMVRASDAETAAQVIAVRDRTQHVPQIRSHSIHGVARGDSLSSLAVRYYGQGSKWPVIFEANRRVIGHNPNLIRPGQKLEIPNLPTVRLERPR